LSVDPGFRTSQVLTFRAIPLGPKYDKPAEWHRYYLSLLQKVRELPGVKYAGSTSHLPLSNRDFQDDYEIEHEENASKVQRKVIDVRTATPGYFEAMGYQLKAGRTFRETDRTPVAMIDEMVARRHWPKGDAIGKRIRSSDQDPWFEIVGVVATIRHRGLDAKADGQIFLPEEYREQSQTFAVQTEGDPTLFVPAIRSAASAIDPNLPLYQVQTMEQLASASLGRRRFAMQLIGFFALLALGLSAVGLYGVMAQSVAARVKEIGIRMALGARSGEVMRMVLRDGLRLTLAGVILGSIAALALSNLLASQLFEVKPYNASTFLMVIGVLGAVSLIAAYIPARRAVRIDPLTALRCE
jgi:predicted permease